MPVYTITPKEQNYSQWYLDIVQKAELAENSEVQGCMVIKPYGYAIWEKIRDYLDCEFKRTGHKNAYFPLFIPINYFAKEASHVEGFATECAVVTHSRLKNINGKIDVDPESKLTEPLVVRPTSETIIWNTYKNWIQSHRDLPILINQWANVVRMEMRTRPFLRTTEFLWQEGHTAHASAKDAIDETMKMLDVYAHFSEDILSIPIIKGKKTDNEKFAGAEDTYCIEGLMQDGKALQMGTSHFLGQNFAKAFNVTFTDKNGINDFVFATSWGVSTRLIGGLIMAHSDNYGLVLPPKIAPIQVVIIPVLNEISDTNAIIELTNKIKNLLIKNDISVHIDDRDYLIPKQKFIEYEIKGVPVRIEIGQKEIMEETTTVFRRDNMKKIKVPVATLALYISSLLEEIQENIYNKALDFRNTNIHSVDSFEEFKKNIDSGGFVKAHWDGTKETEIKIKELTKATIRCIPINNVPENGKCILTNNPSTQRVLFAKSY